MISAHHLSCCHCPSSRRPEKWGSWAKTDSTSGVVVLLFSSSFQRSSFQLIAFSILFSLIYLSFTISDCCKVVYMSQFRFHRTPVSWFFCSNKVQQILGWIASCFLMNLLLIRIWLLKFISICSVFYVMFNGQVYDLVQFSSYSSLLLVVCFSQTRYDKF